MKTPICIRGQVQIQRWNGPLHIMETCLFNYIENLTTKNCKFSDKNSDIFHISAQNIDCGYSLGPPLRGSSNQYQQSMFLSRNMKNIVYPCKPQFYYIKVRFRGVKIIYVCFHNEKLKDEQVEERAILQWNIFSLQTSIFCSLLWLWFRLGLFPFVSFTSLCRASFLLGLSPWGFWAHHNRRNIGHVVPPAKFCEICLEIANADIGFWKKS